jgi:zinc protease
VAADTREPARGIREIRFANGVRLNIKHTDLARDQVLVTMSIDGGSMLNTRDNPMAVQMTSSLPWGGLGQHSWEDLRSILAGHSYGMSLGAAGDTFVSSVRCYPPIWTCNWR